MDVSQQQIEALLREADIEGFIQIGAPADEYASESEVIANALAELHGNDMMHKNVFDIVVEVWATSFGLNETDMKARHAALDKVAREILKFESSTQV